MTGIKQSCEMLWTCEVNVVHAMRIQCGCEVVDETDTLEMNIMQTNTAATEWRHSTTTSHSSRCHNMYTQFNGQASSSQRKWIEMAAESDGRHKCGGT